MAIDRDSLAGNFFHGLEFSNSLFVGSFLSAFVCSFIHLIISGVCTDVEQNRDLVCKYSLVKISSSCFCHCR